MKLINQIRKFALCSILACLACIWIFSGSGMFLAQVATPPPVEQLELEEGVQVQQDDANVPGFERGVVIVKFKQGVAQRLLANLKRERPFEDLTFPDSIKVLNEKFGATKIETLFDPDTVSNAAIAKVKAKFSRRSLRSTFKGPLPRLDHIFKLHVNNNLNIEIAVQEYEKDPNVEYAEPNRVAKITFIPDDTYYNSDTLWGLFNVQAESAWDCAKGTGVVVAVIDTGVDITHCDLQGNIFQNFDEINGTPEVDDDSNGYVDDFNGWDFVENDNDPDDPNGHGTHVSGTIAAVGNNSEGVVGLAFESEIMPVRALNVIGNGFIVDLAKAIVYAAQNGADVINNSWGGPGESATIEAAVNIAHGLGVVVVSAAGNDDEDVSNFFPANIENSMAVSAFTVDDAKASYSNFGVIIDVAAPGGVGVDKAQSALVNAKTNILSTVPLWSYLENIEGYPTVTQQGCEYMALHGTSMAAPHVSALAALIIELRSLPPCPGCPCPDCWTNEEIRQAIRQSTDDVGDPGFDIESGYGRINASKVCTLPSTAPPTASLTEPANGERVEGVVDIKGSADVASGLTGTYDVEIGEGEMPPSFTQIASGTIPPSITDNLFTTWETRDFKDGVHTIRLVVTDTDPLTPDGEDRNAVNIDNVYISVPEDNDIISVSSVDVKGKVAGNLPFVNYTLEWAEGTTGPLVFTDDGVTLFNDGKSKVDDPMGYLGTWDLTPVPDGLITLQLTATFTTHVSTDRVVVIVDKLLLDTNNDGTPEWPVDINMARTLKSPKIVDLDGDGAKELVIGASVFNADGTLKDCGGLTPCWDNNPGVGRTNPAIVNVDGDSDLEVVAAVFTSYLDPDGSPNEGAPVIYAYNPDKSEVWSHPVENPATPLGTYNHGTPSAVSAGDVDGDGELEIVLPIRFIYNNFNNETTVFVLDAKTGNPDWPLFTIAGLVFSSAALADLDDDGALDIILFSNLGGGDAALYVLHADGSPAPGWPQFFSGTHGAAGLADPVLGDIDQDGELEILVGQHIFNHDGFPLPGWPVTSILSRSTGATVPLPDADCEYEAILGAGKIVLWVTEHTGALKFSRGLAFGEDEFILFAWDNGSPGVPIVADIDGDGEVEIIKPGEGTFADPRPMPLYATQGTNPSFPSQFPRFVNVVGLDKIIRSSAAVDDLDGDGQTDVAIAAGGKVYVWDMNRSGLNVPFVPGNNPWPMFQHDLANTGMLLFPPKASFTHDAPKCAGQAVQFTDTSTDCPIAWSWDFGDSNASALQNPTHAYVAGGTYTVTLTATNAIGASTSFSTDVEIAAPTWSRTYDSTGYYYFRSVRQTSDGGYVMVAGSGPCTVLKLDASGDVEWQYAYGDSSYVGWSIEQTSNDGYIVAGGVRYPDYDGWLLKLDSSGGIQWQKACVGAGYEEFRSVKQTTPDNGFVVAGRIYPDNNLLVMKFDSSGGLTWQHIYEEANVWVDAWSVQQTSGDGFVVAGSYRPWLSDGGVLVLKLNDSGGIEWQNVYHGIGNIGPEAIQQTSDNGFVVAGIGWGGFAVLKLSPLGDWQWQKDYGDIFVSSEPSIQQTSDDGFIMAGSVEIAGSPALHDPWVLRLGAGGNVEWQKTYGIEYVVEYGLSVRQTLDEGFIVAGSRGGDARLMKLDPDGEIDPSCTFITDTVELIADLPESVTPAGLVEGPPSITAGPAFATATGTAVVVDEQCADCF